MKFGDRLKTSRLEKGLTQEQVANNFYVTRQTISGWENEISYPDITNLIRISDYYQISLDTLLKEDSGMQEYFKKQEVLQSIKPITWLLVIIDLVSSGLLILSIFGTVNVFGMLQYILDVIVILNAVALIRLAMLQYQLDDHQKNKINLSQNKFMVMGVSLMSVGLLLLLTKFFFASGIITGIGGAIVIVSILYRYLDHISAKK
ncbi:helix-turn-helix domain-containing protein [Leuconostoc citreum]|uniref:helix-turn-helix domain-containing protein n=2 Tax=Leuconostoc TaxID=1243 RepID=UPI0032DFF714